VSFLDSHTKNISMESASDGPDEDIIIRKGIQLSSSASKDPCTIVPSGSSTPTARSVRALQPDDASGQWRFSQCFGDKSEEAAEICDGTMTTICEYEYLYKSESFRVGDIISAVEFDRTGEFLASGDRAGRVVLFRRNHTVPL
jgi:hypothetical protein